MHVALPGWNFDLRHLPAVAARLEEVGYEGLWAGEVNNLDAFTQLALAGGTTEQVRLGAIVPAFTRTAPVLAMTAASVAKAFPGRCTVAVGSSSKLIVETWSGVPFERPLSKVRDVVRFLRQAWSGNAVREPLETVAGAGFRLGEAPRPAPVLMVAGVGPKMIEVAAADGDGVLLNWMTVDDVGALGLTSGPTFEVATMVYVCPTEDPVVAHELARPLLADYLTVPAYAELQRRVGRGPALGPVWEAFGRGDKQEARRLMPASVIDALVVHGSPADCRERVERFAAAGVTPLVVFINEPGAFSAAATALAEGGGDWPSAPTPAS